MKQLTALFLAMTLIFSSVGSTLLFSDDNHVEAKSYKSGKKSFNSSPNNKKGIFLVSLNKKYNPIPIKEYDSLKIFGRVVL